MLSTVNSRRTALFKRWKWKQMEGFASVQPYLFLLYLSSKKKKKKTPNKPVNPYSQETLPPGAALINNLKMG